MCEIYGTSFKKRIRQNEYLNEFFRHSSGHPNGWGLALFDDGEVDIEKEPLQATKSHYLKSRLSEDIVYKQLLAHIRYATIGNETYLNCHPFSLKDISGRRWTFIHNGTIFDCKELEKYTRFQKGDTDSERIILYLIDKVNEAIQKRKLSFGEKFDQDILSPYKRIEIVEEVLKTITPGNKINIILSDGELIYAHTNMTGTLMRQENSLGVIIATSPVSKEIGKICQRENSLFIKMAS